MLVSAKLGWPESSLAVVSPPLPESRANGKLVGSLQPQAMNTPTNAVAQTKPTRLHQFKMFIELVRHATDQRPMVDP
mgnify:CR=1 FL=1